MQCAPAHAYYQMLQQKLDAGYCILMQWASRLQLLFHAALQVEYDSKIRVSLHPGKLLYHNCNSKIGRYNNPGLRVRSSRLLRYSEGPKGWYVRYQHWCWHKSHIYSDIQRDVPFKLPRIYKDKQFNVVQFHCNTTHLWIKYINLSMPAQCSPCPPSAHPGWT